MKHLLSVVVSVYNEEAVLEKFYLSTLKVLNEILWDYELLFINDGSSDNSLNILNGLADENPHVKIISIKVFK